MAAGNSGPQRANSEIKRRLCPQQQTQRSALRKEKGNEEAQMKKGVLLVTRRRLPTRPGCGAGLSREVTSTKTGKVLRHRGRGDRCSTVSSLWSFDAARISGPNVAHVTLVKRMLNAARVSGKGPKNVSCASPTPTPQLRRAQDGRLAQPVEAKNGQQLQCQHQEAEMQKMVMQP